MSIYLSVTGWAELNGLTNGRIYSIPPNIVTVPVDKVIPDVVPDSIGSQLHSVAVLRLHEVRM